jgi:hypothetical protein
MYVVRLANQHAQCAIHAHGRYPLAAYRAAVARAGREFTHYRRDYSVLENEFDRLFTNARKSWMRRAYGRVMHADNGLSVELYRAD